MKKVDQTFIDDPLRILRGIRQATIFGFTISPLTYEGMKRNVDRLTIISKERIQTELNNMLLSQNPTIALEYLHEIGALKYIFPELDELYHMTQGKHHNFDTVWQHTMDVVNGVVRYNDLGLLMAALLHDIGKIATRSVDEDNNIHFYRHEYVGANMCRTILKQLKYPKDFIDDVVFLVENHMYFATWDNDISKVKEKSIRKLQYRCGTFRKFVRLLKLANADNKSCSKEYQNNKDLDLFLVTRKMMHNGTAMFGYKLPVNGNDIMKIRGLKPGRQVARCLDTLLQIAYSEPNKPREWWLNVIKKMKIK